MVCFTMYSMILCSQSKSTANLDQAVLSIVNAVFVLKTAQNYFNK